MHMYFTTNSVHVHGCAYVTKFKKSQFPYTILSIRNYLIIEKPVLTHSIVDHYLEISILTICVSGIKPDSCIQFTTIFWGYL